MCGLTGAVGSNLYEKHKKAFMELMIVSSVRGLDASGVLGVTADWKVPRSKGTIYRLWKGAVPSAELVVSEGYKGAVDNPNTRLLMGHCRSKTIGANITANAHPFDLPNLIGVHNGTLRGNYPGEREYATDSEALYKLINDEGIAAAIPQIHGAYALTWFDKRDSTINFLRNNERDLWFANEKMTGALFWASEPYMLRWVLHRNSIEVDRIVQLAKDTVMSFAVLEEPVNQSLSIVEDIKGKDKAVYTNLTPFRQVTKTHTEEETNEEKTMTLAALFAAGQGQDTAADATPISTTRGFVAHGTGRKPKADKGKDVYKGYLGVKMDKEELISVLDEGCTFCGKAMKPKEPFRWIYFDEYLCDECKDSPAFAFTDFDEREKSAIN